MFLLFAVGDCRLQAGLGSVPSAVNSATTEGRVLSGTEYTCRRNIFFELIKLAAGFFGTAVSSGMLQEQYVVAGNKHTWMAWGLGSLEEQVG